MARTKDTRSGGPTPGSDTVSTGGQESKNVEKKTGRPDGTGGGQKTSGHKQESAFPTGSNAEKRVRPWAGSNRGEDIARGTVPETTRTDLVREVGESE